MKIKHHSLYTCFIKHNYIRNYYPFCVVVEISYVLVICFYLIFLILVINQFHITLTTILTLLFIASAILRFLSLLCNLPYVISQSVRTPLKYWLLLVFGIKQGLQNDRLPMILHPSQ